MMYGSVIALLVAVATPAAAQLVDPLAMTTDPADRAVMAEAASAIASRPPDLSRLDAILAKLPRPTPLRGMVQTVRASALAGIKDPGAAVVAVEEGLRLLPDDPRPKMVATYIFTFAGSPQRAADLWMAMSRESADYARTSDRYLMMALIGRLNDLGDRTGADRINARLGEIGFSAGLADERSTTSLARVRQAMRAAREDEALQGVTAIGGPDDLLTLYVDWRYAILWPRIAEWAGVDLDAQSRRYLEEVRGDWAAADDFKTATPYARRLASLRAYTAVIALFLPMFDRLQPGARQADAEFLAPVVARSLATLGRSADARALLAKVAATMPANDGGNALNIEGTYITLAKMDADWPQVLAHADTFLARAHSLGSSVNVSAVLQVQAMRACALWRMGRAAEAQQSVAEVLLGETIAPSLVMEVHLCRGDADKARALVIRRLTDQTTRGWALSFVQPVRVDTDTQFERLLSPITEAVRTAPDVAAAANRVGRILPRPVGSGLPTGFDPFRAQPRTKPLTPGAI